MKTKETLEEAAENHLQKWRLLNNIHLSNILHAERCKNDFIAGAKWQQERMYSEEEVIAFGEFIFKHSLLTHTKGVNSLFEQFKNK